MFPFNEHILPEATIDPNKNINIWTRIPLDKMVAISLKILSDAFSWMKSFLYLGSNSTEVYYLWSNWQSSSTGLDNGLVPARRQAIIWTNGDPIHWHIYATLGADELKEVSKRGIVFGNELSFQMLHFYMMKY